MNNKKIFYIISISLLVNLLILPNISFAENSYVSINPVLYISGQYRPGVSHFGKLSVKETHKDIKQLVALKKEVSPITSVINTNTSFDSIYNAEFEDNAISFSGAVGFSYAEGPRIEIEASYEEFDVKNPGGYTVADAFRYFALARSTDTNPQQPVSDKFTVMKNNGLSIGSVIINGCYDFTLDEAPASPYICVGIGGDFIEFFDQLHVKLAYQGKIGISYPIYNKINLFANGYYHKVVGNKFRNLDVQHVVDLNEHPKITSAIATLNVSYFGGEIGARLAF